MIDPQRRAWLSRAWHGVLVLVVAASLATQVVLSVSGSEPGADPALSTRLVRLVSYFTIQSNLLVLIGAVAVTLRPDTDGPVWRVLRLDGVLGITITGIVYSTVLAGINDPQGAAAFTNFGFHHFAPWWALAGWLLFGPRPRIDRRTLSRAVLWPLLWIGYTLLHGAVTGWYPYPFTDVAELGYPAVLVNLAAVLLITVVLGALLRTLDRRLAACPDAGAPPLDGPHVGGPPVDGRGGRARVDAAEAGDPRRCRGRLRRRSAAGPARGPWPPPPPGPSAERW